LKIQKVKHIDIDKDPLTFFSMTAITVSSKYQIVIPKEFRNLLGIKSGTRLQAISDSQGLRLVKEPEIDDIKGLLKGLPVDDTAIRQERDRDLA
jgi:AbrB family looped-hinge helix DNA binding protein